MTICLTFFLHHHVEKLKNTEQVICTISIKFLTIFRILQQKTMFFVNSHTYIQSTWRHIYVFFFLFIFFLSFSYLSTYLLSSPCLLFPVRHCFLVHNRWRVKIMAGNNWIFAQLTWRPAGEIRGGTPTIDRYLQIWYEKRWGIILYTLFVHEKWSQI